MMEWRLQASPCQGFIWFWGVPGEEEGRKIPPVYRDLWQEWCLGSATVCREKVSFPDPRDFSPAPGMDLASTRCFFFPFNAIMPLASHPRDIFLNAAEMRLSGGYSHLTLWIALAS